MGPAARAAVKDRGHRADVGRGGNTVKRLLTALLAGAALATAGSASADPLRVGVADDWPQYKPCGDVWWKSADDIGYSEVRLTVQWNGTPAIPNPSGIQTAVSCALQNHVLPVLAIYPAKPTLIGSSTLAQATFAQFVAQVGQTFPQVTNFIVGNEPNVNRFWQPQFVDGKDAAAKDYEHTLAQSYDALKFVRPNALVWGPAISSRGNDDPFAKSNPSHSPVMFIKELGDAYRASNRKRPIFDEFDMHPYPSVQDTAPYTKPFLWPQAGAADLGRVKQALWDAFHGTHQAVPAEQPPYTTSIDRTTLPGLPINLDEVGSQTIVPAADATAYDGTPESIAAITSTQQAAYYTQLLTIAECDPDVSSLMFFPLIDDPTISGGFQSGELYADLTHKVSYDAIKNDLVTTQGLCPAPFTTTWQHTTQVIAAQVVPAWRPYSRTFTVSAGEAVTYKAALFQIQGSRKPSSADVARMLASAQRPPTVAAALDGSIRAYYKPSITFGTRQLPAGLYVCGITLTAVANPGRTTTFVSKPFVVKRSQ